jgi:hypothetical protein
MAVLLFVWSKNTVQSGGSPVPTNHINLQQSDVSNNFRAMFSCPSGKGGYPASSDCVRKKYAVKTFDAFLAYPDDCSGDICDCSVFIVSYNYSGRIDISRDGRKLESLNILPGQAKWSASVYNIANGGKISISSPGIMGVPENILVLNRIYPVFMAGEYLFLKGRDTNVARTFGDHTAFSVLPDGKYNNEISAVFITDESEKKEAYYSAARYAAIVRKNEFSLSDLPGESLKVLRNSGDLLPGNNYNITCMVFDADRNMTGGTVWNLTYKP